MGVYRRPAVSYWSPKIIYHDHFFNILNFYKFVESYFDEQINLVMRNERDDYLLEGLDYFKVNNDKDALLKYISEYTNFFFYAEKLANDRKNNREKILVSSLMESGIVKIIKRYTIRIFWIMLCLLVVNTLFLGVLIW